MTFDDFHFEPELLDGIDSMNYTDATPIQQQAIPPLLLGKDVLGIAQTGTGKTAAYLLPIMNRIFLGEFPNNKLKAVVVVPTRELALQIDQQIQGFGYYVGISSIAIHGGTDGFVWEQQVRSLQRGADIIVATPGRLIDLLNNKETTIGEARYLVIDEADRMLDMGFYDDIVTIRKQLAEDCQVALFSATMPKKIAQLANKMLRKPVRIEIAISKPPETIQQVAYVCYEAQKLSLIIELLGRTDEVKRTVIFVSSKKKATEITPKIRSKGIVVEQMHAMLEQKQREQVIRDFKSGYVKVLVATDIVARGIDIIDIEEVINYDMPRDNEDYVHRIGRTARGTETQGSAITLVTDKDLRAFDNLQHFLGQKILLMPLPVALGSTPEYIYNSHPHQKRINKKRTKKRYQTARIGGKKKGNRSKGPIS